VTQQIVHQYNGSIHVESKVGEGTIVIIQFPVENKSEEKKSEEQVSSPVKLNVNETAF